MNPNSLSEKIGKVVFHAMAFSGIASFALFVGFIGYETIKRGVPSTLAFVTDWWYDTTTALTEHHWQFTDALLYGGLLIITAVRFRHRLSMLFDKYLQ